MKYTDIIKIDLTDNEILEAVRHARKESFLDNLRERNEFVALDSKIRGYMGEIFLKNLFSSNDIKISDINHKDSRLGVDIDIEITTISGESLKVECKTSLVPDYYKTIQNCISRCDIKIIQREYDFNSIPIDIHIQIYFNELTEERDAKLSQIDGHIDDYSDEKIVELLKLKELDGYFVAWIDKKSLNTYLSSFNSYSERIWGYGYRKFWRCPLSMSYAPNQLIEYLKNK